MALTFNTATQNGTATDDILVGHHNFATNHTLNGNAGSDVLFGDYDFFVTAAETGATAAAAFNMTSNTQLWSRIDDAIVQSSTATPHAAAIMEGNGTHKLFRFDLALNQRLTVDVDYADTGRAGGFDSRIQLLAADGVTVLATNDNSSTLLPDVGSLGNKDAFLSYLANTAGTYYIRVVQANGAAVATGSTYVANFSLTGQTVQATAKPGLAGADNLNGGDGNDTMYGGGGNDTILGGNDTDVMYGGTGNDLIDGGAGKDKAFGGLGDDTFRWSGADVGDDVNGDAGVDTLDLSNRSDNLAFSVNLTTGVGGLTVNTLGANGTFQVRSIENVTGTIMADTLIGNGAVNDLRGGAGDDLLEGRDGNDILNGGAGNDQLVGGNGNDRYIVDSATDVVVETATGGATDTVFTSVSYALAAGVAVETLATSSVSGTTAINLTGNAGKQLMIGNAGSNILNSGIGAADTMQALGGNDVYRVNNTGDIVIEASGQGFDTVQAAVNYRLSSTAWIEQLWTNDAAGTSAINLTGNAVGQDIRGNNGANIIDGLLGNDVLTGNGGADVFRFTTAVRNNVDTITDFAAGTDRLQLEDAVFFRLTAVKQLDGSLSSTAFTANEGGVATNASHRVVYDTDSGDLYYDADGSGVGLAQRIATLDNLASLSASDIFII